MIDVNKVGVYVLTTDGHIDFRLILYLSKLGMKIPNNLTVFIPDCELVRARNLSYQKLIKPHVQAKRFEWYLFLDKDIYFEPNSSAFWEETDADVVGCQYNFTHESSWVRPDEFHMGCVRVHQRILEQLELPLWDITYNNSRTKLEACDCSFFRSKLLSVGAKIERRGICGHDNHKSWFVN